MAFGAFKDHCSFFVMSYAVLEAHRDELKPYLAAKGTLHFTAAKPLPAALVKKLVRARIAENEARTRTKGARRSGPRHAAASDTRPRTQHLSGTEAR